VNPNPATPRDILDAYRHGVDNFVNSKDPSRLRLRAARPEGVPVFMLTSERLSDEDPAQSAQKVGWRLLVRSPGTDPLLADVAEGSRHPEPTLVKLAGTSPGESAKIVEFAKDFDAIREDERLRATPGFELRLLRVAGIADAFWLRSPDGKSDVVFPTLAPKEIKGKRITLEAFLDALRPLADKFREFDRYGGMRHSRVQAK
jgi:hypothetical protein